MRTGKIYGDEYLSAFFDNEKKNPKLKPGQCRIINEELGWNIRDVQNNDGLPELQLLIETHNRG